ncbi:hypothetical protein QTP88_018893 [Uroleucon formosanum]
MPPILVLSSQAIEKYSNVAFRFSGQIISAVLIKHVFIKSPSVNGFECFAINSDNTGIHVTNLSANTRCLSND